MTSLQKIELRRSEIRSRLGEIAGLSGDALTKEVAGERDRLMVELSASEPQLRAAIASEESENRARTEDGEGAEYRALCERVSLGRFVSEAHRMVAVDGAEAELRAAVFGDHARIGMVPWEALDPGRGRAAADEHRVDTDVTGNAGALQQTVLGRIFAGTAAAYLGVRMDVVDRGVSAYPVISDGAIGAQTAKGAAQAAEAATVAIDSLEPVRLTARYTVRVEDLARIAMLEESLRADLVGALGEQMDKQILTGNGAAPNVQGFTAAIAAAAVPGEVAAYGDYAALPADAVDGRGAIDEMQVRTLAPVDAYKKAAATFTDAGTYSASGYLRMSSGGFRASALLPSAPSSGARQNVSDVLIHRAMAPGSAVAPIWSGFEILIRDDVTGADSGEISLTMIQLWNFKMVRAAGYQRAAVKLA